MKRSTVFCIALPFVLALSACVSTSSPESSSPKPNKAQAWIFTDAGLENAKTPAMAVVSVDAPGESPEFRAEAGSFGKVAWLYSIMDKLELHAKLSLDAKEALLKALFTRLPANPTDNIYRATAIGGYFKDGDPLILYSRAYKPSASAPAGSSIILDLRGNFIITKDKKTGISEPSPLKGVVMANFNWYTNGIAFSDGRLVRAGYLYSADEEKSIKEDAAGDKALEKVNLADLFLKDEDPANDASAVAALREAIADPAASPETRTTGWLNLVMGYLALDDVAQARTALASALDSGKGIADPAFREVLDIQAPQMIELYARLTAK